MFGFEGAKAKSRSSNGSGRPEPILVQEEPPSVVRKRPPVLPEPQEASAVAAPGRKRTLRGSGQACTCDHVAPASAERQIPSSEEKFERTVAITTEEFVGWTASELICAPPDNELSFANGPGMCVQVAPPSVDLRMPLPPY